MSTSVASDLQTASPRPLAVRVKKIAIVAAKFLVTGACFWYVARQIDLSDLLSAIPLLDFRWVAFATLIVMLQIPLLALRWRNILSGLGACNERMTRTAMVAMAAIGVF